MSWSRKPLPRSASTGKKLGRSLAWGANYGGDTWRWYKRVTSLSDGPDPDRYDSNQRWTRDSTRYIPRGRRMSVRKYRYYPKRRKAQRA